jgi:hypothetical protein
MWEKQLEREEYEFLEHNMSAKPMPNMKKQDYKALIDLALEMRDFEWVKSLSRKMKKKFADSK